MTLYVETMSNRSKLEKKQSFGYSNENFSVSKNNQKCTIDTINNQYLLVTYVGEKEGKTNYNIFVYNIGNDFLLTYSHTLNFDSTLSLKSSYQQTFGCVNALNYKYLCLYVDNNGLNYLEGDITSKTLPNKIKYNTDLQITEMVLSKNHFNPNDEQMLFRYIIGLKDSNGNYYHLPLIVNKTKYEFGSINKISYGSSPSLNSFSGFSKTKTDYNPVYFDGTHISIEHIRSSSKYTLSFKPINSFDITFSSINQPEIISDTYIIITGWKDSYIYVIDVPRPKYQPDCLSGDMMLGPGITKTINIQSSAPYITIPSTLYGNQLINRDNQVKISVDSNYKNAVITTPDKERITNIPIIFSFYEENISPSKVAYLSTLPNKIESLYYFGNDCMISLSTCYSTCETCNQLGNATDHLCEKCKKDYRLNENKNCKQTKCNSGYVLYDDMCILCPESNTPSKKWYFDPSISSSSCIYNKSSDCPLNAKYYVPDLKQCLSKCPEEFPLYIPSTGECLNKCPQRYPYMLEKLLCLDKCPEYSQEVFKKECDCYMGLDESSKNEIKCKKVKCIECNDIIVSEECLQRLMDEYSIDDASKFRYYKNIIKRPNQVVNQIEFKIMLMTDDGILELNTSLCNDTNFTSTVQINEDVVKPELINKTYEEGYDIFDPNDNFYTDSCISFSDGNVDLTYSQRKKYYKNYAVCETDCTYLNYNPEKMAINCNCKFKKYSKTERTFAVIETNEDFNKTESVSSNLMKCMKNLIKNGDLGNGAMASGSTMSIGEVSLLIYYLVHNSSMFKSLLGAFMLIASPPKSDSNESDESDDDYDSPPKKKEESNNDCDSKKKEDSDESDDDYGPVNNKPAPAPSALPQNNVNEKRKGSNNSNGIDSELIPVSNNGIKNNTLNKNSNVINLINGKGNSKNKNENNNNNNNNNSNNYNNQNNQNNVIIHKGRPTKAPKQDLKNGQEFPINEMEIIRRYMDEKPKFDPYTDESKSLCARPILNDKIFDYNFEESKKKKLPFMDYYINLLFYNQMFLFVISKEKWNFFITKLSLFINLIFFLMLFNTLLIDESLLNSINQEKRKLCLGKAIGRIIASVILTVLANFILKLIGLLRIEFEGIKWTNIIIDNNEKPVGVARFMQAQFGSNNQNNENSASIENNINRNSENSQILYYKGKTIEKDTLKRHIFLRTLFYFIISIVLGMFITFYVSAFCGMYKKTRMNLFVYILISFLLIMIYPFFLCGIIAGLRHYGLKKNKEMPFNISKKLEWILLL